MKASPCHHASIITCRGTEYPLSDRYGMSYSYEGCEECGKEVEEPVELCDCCGDLPRSNIIETKLGGWCEHCLNEHAADLMVREEVKV